MEKVLMMLLARTIQVLLTGGVKAATELLNRHFETIRTAEAKGRDVSDAEQRAMTDAIAADTEGLGAIVTRPTA